MKREHKGVEYVREEAKESGFLSAYWNGGNRVFTDAYEAETDRHMRRIAAEVKAKYEFKDTP